MTVRIGIVAALAGEIAPLVKDWKREAGSGGKPAVFLRRERDVEWLATASGMGRSAAARGVDAVTSHGDLDALVSAGWAGGLSCGVQPGRAYAVQEVVDVKTGERYGTATQGAGALRLVTSDRIVSREEKRKLGERYAAALVDMEAVAVARLAEARQIPFFCWKAITDIATEEMPDFNRFLGRDEQLQMGRLIAHVSVRPRHWPALLRLQRNGKAGALALRDAVLDGLRDFSPKGYYASSGE